MKGTLEERIKHLQEQGYEVDIEHRRIIVDVYPGLADSPTSIRPKGGSTRAVIKRATTEDVISEAWAECCLEDNYSRSIGAQIALGRAEKRLQNG